MCLAHLLSSVFVAFLVVGCFQWPLGINYLESMEHVKTVFALDKAALKRPSCAIISSQGGWRGKEQIVSCNLSTPDHPSHTSEKKEK